jgi:hypothetical protein
MLSARRALAALPVVIGLAASAAAAQQEPQLGRYEARTIVTGTDLRSRPAGMAACLTDVLIKVSGDPTVRDDPRLRPLAAQAGNFATDFDYWDRMSGIAHHDEQGSSDRPYNLTVRFDPGRIDAALRSLDRAPWTGPRPALVVRVRVEGAHDAFDLIASDPRGAGMRAALTDAATKYGMAVLMPDVVATPPPGAVALPGRLVLSQAALGWVVSWHLDWRGAGYDWGVSGVNFDEAFDDGVRGAMQVLSGHGAPQ